MGRVLITVTLLLSVSSLVTIPVIPTISPIIGSSTSSNTGGNLLARKPLTSDIHNIRNVRTIQLQYKVKLYVGTPPQDFEMIVDTGSDVTLT